MSNVGRREIKKMERRNNIINAAEELFFSRGYDNVSLNEIAKKADLGRSTVYLYFESKEELFFAIILNGAHILHKMIMTGTSKAKTSFEKLAAFRKAYYKFANKYPDYLKAYNYLISGRFDLTNIGPEEYRFRTRTNYNENKKRIEEVQFPNFPIPKFTASEYLSQILILRHEMLNVLVCSIELGKKEGTIRPDVNSVEATVILTLIANSIDNLPPDLSNLLKTQNINHEQFLVDVGEFIGYMVSNRGSTKK